ncbi:flagellar basal-body rod protein FlgG [Scopulibacillus daqui]|uniref:Flagellar basal-body rod protein FlgG n=1 Tax=Scopulibacillus daqui TaxID=1469162 RepID=A0ABS2Q203_9BACL|nr:flagellar hook-basal body protein [Scopulibacillus daqui]MBM7645885.1 flagellar basal-body rod protein FlgG [Scopulibacillus daqui]
MDRSLMTAAVTMGQLQNKMDLISNNMANASTTGYKSQGAEFADLLVQQLNNLSGKDRNGRLTPDGIRAGTGAKLGNIDLNMNQGSMKPTRRSLDLALLNPDHFFKIGVKNNRGEQTIMYTRNGTFYLRPDQNNAMKLVTADGNDVLDSDNQPIYVPADVRGIKIDKSGVINVLRTDGENFQAGAIGVVNIKYPQVLQANGENIYTLPPLNGLGYTVNDVVEPVGQAEANIKQGALEASNVDLSKEMTDLISMERSYQMNARAISIADQMMGLANSLR